jgi:hypothetical protein
LPLPVGRLRILRRRRHGQQRNQQHENGTQDQMANLRRGQRQTGHASDL